MDRAGARSGQEVREVKGQHAHVGRHHESDAGLHVRVTANDAALIQQG